MNADTPKKKHPILALLILTMLALGCLAATAMLCLPYMDLPQRTEAPTKEPTEEETWIPDPEPTLETTEETTIPTIPPDSNPLGKFDFQYNRNNYLVLSEGESYPGVDVSAFQGKIDWQKVKDSGITFAMLRLGYRGYGQKGTLVKDEYIDDNLKGAQEAGLSIGAYFFSQATDLMEVDEEIEFMMEILGDCRLDMPIVFDWEYISETARTANVDAQTLTDMTLYFCKNMEKKGFRPMVYFNWHQADSMMYLKDLEEYPFWLAYYDDRMVYPYKVEMWQWTSSGTVPGIDGNVDINVYFP